MNTMLPGLRRRRLLAVAALTGMLGVTACSGTPLSGDPSGQSVPDDASVVHHNPAASVEPSASPAPSPAASSQVRVVVRGSAQDTAATTALVTFVRAHAASMRSGEALPALKRVSTPAQWARQQRLVRRADREGLTVPRQPVVRLKQVRAHEEQSPPRVEVDVCFWLPSTEYRDTSDAEPNTAAVPKRWLPAVATLVRKKMTWRVDTIVPPQAKERIECGGPPRK